jgi:hypothetical protein
MSEPGDGWADRLRLAGMLGEPRTITLEGYYDDANHPRERTCLATPCEVCGACSDCGDFHFYAGRGCTEDNCPNRRG